MRESEPKVYDYKANALTIRLRPSLLDQQRWAVGLKLEKPPSPLYSRKPF